MTGLSPGEFLRTREGTTSRLRASFVRGLRLLLEGEPKSKKAMKEPEKIYFQKAVLGQIEATGRHAFRGDVAVDLTFSTSAPTPPYLHTAVKNLLYLMGAPLGNFTDRKGLCYQDDRQIKALSANYHISSVDREGESSTTPPGSFVRIYPLRDFVAGLEAVVHLSADTDESGLQAGRSSVDEYLDFLEDSRTWPIQLPEKTMKGLRSWLRQDAQKEVLRSISLNPRQLLSLYVEAGQAFGARSDGILASFWTDYATWVRTEFFRLNIPLSASSVPCG